MNHLCDAGANQPKLAMMPPPRRMVSMDHAFPPLSCRARRMTEQIVACVEAACAAGDVRESLSSRHPGQPHSSPTSASGPRGPGRWRSADSDERPAPTASRSRLEAYREARRYWGRIALSALLRHLAPPRHGTWRGRRRLCRLRPGGPRDLISWWSEIFEIPCIAADPVSAESLDILLPHRPDFIRPDDAMWTSPEAARDIVQRLTARLKE